MGTAWHGMLGMLMVATVAGAATLSGVTVSPTSFNATLGPTTLSFSWLFALDPSDPDMTQCNVNVTEDEGEEEEAKDEKQRKRGTRADFVSLEKRERERMGVSCKKEMKLKR